MSARPPHDELCEAYERVRPLLAARGEALRAELAGWLDAAPGLKVHSVTVRLKSRPSLAQKLARPDRGYADLWDVTDLLGLRVITYFEDEVDRVGKVVEARLPVDLASSTDKRRRRDAGSFGYRSLHYVCRLGEDGGALPARARGEIQVRTVLEHAWAEIEHDLGYKADGAVPDAARRRLMRIAGLLELADQEFVAIRRDLDDYARALPRRIEADADHVPIDRLSLAPLLDTPEVRAADAAIAGALDRELGDQPFFPDYLIKMLTASGVTTVAAAREGVTAHAPRLAAMAGPYFGFAARAWRLSPDRMDRLLRGYALFFLAHAVVLDRGELHLDKVERLAALYRELDYPDDERAAHQVASQLVEAFRQVTP